MIKKTPIQIGVHDNGTVFLIAGNRARPISNNSHETIMESLADLIQDVVVTHKKPEKQK